MRWRRVKVRQPLAVDAAAGDGAERRELRYGSLLAPGVCGDRQQFKRPAGAGARGIRAAQRAANDVFGAAFAPLQNPTDGTAGSAGLRERGGGIVDSADRAPVARWLAGNRTRHGPRSARALGSPRD